MPSGTTKLTVDAVKRHSSVRTLSSTGIVATLLLVASAITKTGLNETNCRRSGILALIAMMTMHRKLTTIDTIARITIKLSMAMMTPDPVLAIWADTIQR